MTMSCRSIWSLQERYLEKQMRMASVSFLNMKMFLIKRARIVAGASDKIPTLRKYIQKYQNDNHMLIYCGATTTRS